MPTQAASQQESYRLGMQRADLSAPRPRFMAGSMLCLREDAADDALYFRPDLGMADAASLAYQPRG